MKYIFIQLYNYLKEYKLIYIGIVLCNVSCLTFYKIYDMDEQKSNIIFLIVVVVIFMLSFVLPIFLSVIFTVKCFTAKTKKKILVNIIHSYFGTIFIFTALYFQCSVYGDFEDAVHKRLYYNLQLNIKKNSEPNLKIIKVADQRAFKGIKPRLWSGYDYPNSNLLYGIERNPDSWLYFQNNDYEELSVEQIERIARNHPEYGRITYYQNQNVKEIYIDCFYFSVVSIATVGFGDITPNLWYTKLFAAFEVFIGLSLFVFALGMLFSSYQSTKKGDSFPKEETQI